MVRADSYGLMEALLMEISSAIKWKVMASINGLTAGNMMDNGSKISNTAKVLSFGLMDENTAAATLMTSEMAKAYLDGKQIFFKRVEINLRLTNS